MNLSDLQTFRAVVDHGGVGAAARQLHRVQSSVSARVSSLERSLGCELFERRGKRLALTPEGRHLYERSAALVQGLQQLQHEFALRQTGGVLRIGSMESTAAVRLAPVLAALRDRHPQLQLSVRTGTTGDLLEALERCEIDVAFVAGPGGRDGLDWQAAYTEELVMIAPRRAPPPATLVTFSTGCAYREVARAWALANGYALEQAVEIGSYHAMVAAVSAGMGVALVPRSVLARCDASAVRIRRLGPAFSRQTTWCVTRAAVSSPAVRVLREAVAG